MLSDLIKTLEIVKNLMNDDSLSIKNVINEISDRSGVPKEDILGKSRKENIIFLREGGYYIYRKKFKLYYQKIADLTKRENHTTIIHGVKAIKNGFEIYGKKLS